MKRRYELTVVISPEASADLAKTAKSIENLIEKFDGKVVSKDEWGERELAYPIQKQTKGMYWFQVVEMAPENVKKFDAALRLMPEVIRYLLLRTEE